MRALLVWNCNVVVRDVTMGFGPPAHYYTDIRQALGMSGRVLVRTGLDEGRDTPIARPSDTEVARLAIEVARRGDWRAMSAFFRRATLSPALLRP